MLNEFISNAKLLVNTLGYKVFDSIEEATATHEGNKVVFTINAARGATAKGIIVSDGFVVFKDSMAAYSTVPSISESLIRLRMSLYEKGIINEHHIFTRDYVFTSPSLAAAVIMGRNANGRTEWKTSDRKTIKDIEESELD